MELRTPSGACQKEEQKEHVFTRQAMTKHDESNFMRRLEQYSICANVLSTDAYACTGLDYK